MAVIVISEGPVRGAPAAPSLTTRVIPGPPEQFEVSDETGVLAMLTTGARTVLMRGPQRTFTENKRPFTDRFQRTVSGGWGGSPGGGNWSMAGAAGGTFSVNGTTGIVNVTSINVPMYTSVIDALTDADVRCSVSTTMPSGAPTSVGLVLGYTSATNHYRAVLSIQTDGTLQMSLEKEVDGATTVLGAPAVLSGTYTTGTVWGIRAERTGTTIRCRAWRDGDAEPNTWVHTVTDTSLGAGRVGTRTHVAQNSTAAPLSTLWRDFAVVSGRWPNPPVVTHAQWVRVLPAPFTGDWSPAVAAQIAEWADDTRPDVLEYAMNYTTGAPTVTSAAEQGARIQGQATYGPLQADGSPQEGGDFHEYMGRPWTFVNGEIAPANDPKWMGSMDCSGYVRMVYGYHLGIPMVRNTGFTGLTLPRQTKEIGPSGPGVIVAQTTDAPTPLGQLQIGDIPLFDADSGDPGVIDHDGIYIGVDTGGNHRFVNSRKTPNGVTFADLGGPSLLNGTGLYATSLRIIRRF
ncbi:NlpC/P60 family protein [Streptomyces sp. NPDC005562]|uniref:NlpC/P60 family protein n=1 Tax=Streptomyces sp. NPDC005562 TaxID=3154890 RepID=UPI0033B4B4E0